MPGKLDLTVAPWLPLNPAVSKAHGLYRDEPYTLTLNFWTDDTKTVGRDMSDGLWQAQIRAARLTGSTAGDPLAQFSVDDSGAAGGEGVPAIIVISLVRVETRDLALRTGIDAFWELQDEISGETPLTGKVRIFDDAGRPA